MRRSPSCENVGVKKGPWTPEEDIILVSYVQEHGPGNWKTVPTNTGLLRCSKSCRLRWTNYLRPGIKRGNFTDHEEKLIIHLQALLGNRWAAIASYLSQRTDNDIKNYWNTHLKKKLRSMQHRTPISDHNAAQVVVSSPYRSWEPAPRGQWEKRLQTNIHTARQALREALSLKKPLGPPLALEPKPNNKATGASQQTRTTSYASSTENIAQLLRGGWMKKMSPPVVVPLLQAQTDATARQLSAYGGPAGADSASTAGLMGPRRNDVSGDPMSADAFELLSRMEPLDLESSSSDGSRVDVSSPVGPTRGHVPLSLLEKLLLDEGCVAAAQGKEGFAEFSLTF